MKICSIVSARPNFVKLAAITHIVGGSAFKTAQNRRSTARAAIKHKIIHTGQHSDALFSDIFFKELDIPEPDKNLGIQSSGNNEDTVGRTREACMPVLREMQPDIVLVYGDVSGSLGGALAAKESGIDVAHIEAGLRSGDLDMPEERNRVAIDKISKYLFVTEESGVKNLEKEGITDGVHFVGNTMIDTLIRMKHLIKRQGLPMNLPDEFGIVTMHRPGNVDDKRDLERNIQFLNTVAESCPLVLPMHSRTRGSIERHNLQDMFHENVRVIDSIGYLSFLKLIFVSRFVLTDSGGVQEETTFLSKKCFTLRKNTERPSTIESGGNTLIDIENPDDCQKVLDYAADPKPPNVTIPEKWDGKAGERIVKYLCE